MPFCDFSIETNIDLLMYVFCLWGGWSVCVCCLCVPILILKKCTKIFTKYMSCVSLEGALWSTRNTWATWPAASLSLDVGAISHFRARFPSSVKGELGRAYPKRVISYCSNVATKPNFCCFIY